MDRYGFTSVHEVARILNLTRQTVVKLLEKGDLPGVKLGNRWRIPVERLADRLGVDPREIADPETSITHRYPGAEAVA